MDGQVGTHRSVRAYGMMITGLVGRLIGPIVSPTTGPSSTAGRGLVPGGDPSALVAIVRPEPAPEGQRAPITRSSHDLTAAAQTDTSDMPAVHQVFRSSLASAPDVHCAAPPGDEERRALIANYYDNVICFLEVHHDGEEAAGVPPAWPSGAPEHQVHSSRRPESEHHAGGRA